MGIRKFYYFQCAKWLQERKKYNGSVINFDKHNRDAKIKQTAYNTFAAFIDFRKAYDCINRKLLFNKFGLNGNILNAMKSLCDGVQCCVRVNALKTEWFPVDCGLKQGCSLSPTLFIFYIDDLVSSLSELDVGININDEKSAILMYADDVVLLSENEQDLQCLLDALKKLVSR